jgi:DNA-binding transcriptional LysR family regulator
MEVRQLKYLISAIRRGSIRAAADAHFVTQPAVSIQLRKLEEELGEKLFMRSGRGVVPTETGAYFIRYADDILQRIEALGKTMQELKGLQSGYLRIGAIDSAGVYVLPPVFRSFRKKHPGVEIRVTVSDTRGLIESLDSGEVELAIVTLPHSGEGFTVWPVYNDQMVLVAHSRHELAGMKRPTLRAVADAGLIMYPSQSTTRRLIERVFIENEISPRAIMEISSPEAMKRLTEAGLGASILPFQVVAPEIRRGSLKVISTGRARFSRMLGLVCRDETALSPPGRVFLDMLKLKYRIRSGHKKQGLIKDRSRQTRKKQESK